MKKFYFTLCVVVSFSFAHAQQFSVDDLVSFTAYTPSKFENTISRKGYRHAGYGAAAEGENAYAWFDKKRRSDSIEKYIFKSDLDDRATIAYQTTSETEFHNLEAELKDAGYHVADAEGALYQKGNITITPEKKEEESKTVYKLRIERKALPKAKDLVFAEDFLQITSHEYLASIFGEAAVKRDVFYFSDKEINRCSVLFPNTSMQIIFIWNDEVNLRHPAFILVGGQLRAEGSQAYHKQIEQNVWRSRQGIYAGMTLRELERLNGKEIHINGWQSEKPGVVDQQNTGEVDFKAVNLVLNCLDCNEDEFYKVKNEVLNSGKVLREGRRVYVSSMIFLPKK